MLNILFEKYNKIAKIQNCNYKRYFYNTIDFRDKMIGILGSRGVGKTTLILQYLDSQDLPKSKKTIF